MFLTQKKLSGLTIASALALTALSAPAMAQQAGNVFTDEVVVTAQKREQNIQDVGIAITAVTGDQMQALGYTNAQEITALTPGVSMIQPNGEANYAIGIRGVANNDFTTNVESPIAIYVDEVYISQMSGAGFMLFDMERAEVLRGPQGTLFGRNATGGLVQYVTVKPDTSGINGYSSLTYGKFNQMKYQGAVNVPLAENLAMRISAATHQRDGYVHNRLNPNQNLNNANDFANRVQFMWEGGDWDALLNLRQGRQDIRTGFFQHVSAPEAGVLKPSAFNPYVGAGKYDATDTDNDPATLTPRADFIANGGYIDNDGDNFAGAYDFQGHNDLETKGQSLTLNYERGGVKFTSISDYSTTERDYIEDSDASPEDYFNFFLTTDAEQLSQEFRFEGEVDNARWVVGAYYLDLEVNDSNGGIAHGFICDYFEVLGLGASKDCREDTSFRYGVYNPYTTETESTSIFGQWEQDLADDMTVIIGGRWIEEEKDHSYRDVLVKYDTLAISGVDYRTAEEGDLITPYKGNRDDSEWAARLQLDWRPTADTLYYASWNRGVKSGGFNAPLLPTAVPALADTIDTLAATKLEDDGVTSPSDAETAAAKTAVTPAATALFNAREAAFEGFMNYEPEQLDAFEVGFKYQTADNRMTINGAAYYYDYQDYQAFAIIGLDTYTRNAEAESWGAELEIKASPAPGLDVLFGASYIDVEVTDVPGINSSSTDAYEALIAHPTATVGTAPVKPVQTPEVNLNALVRYEMPTAGGNVAFQLDAEYRDEHYFNLTNTDTLKEDGYTLVNGSIAYFPSANDNVTIRFAGHNLTDEEYVVQGFDLSGSIFDAGTANQGFWGMVEHYYGKPRTLSVSVNYLF